MFLKIVFKSLVKKLKFKDEWSSLENFQKLIEGVTGLPVGSFELKFRDSEDDLVAIHDRHDMEYFMDTTKSETFSTIYVLEKEEVNRSIEFLEVSQNEDVNSAQQLHPTSDAIIEEIEPQEILVEEVPVEEKVERESQTDIIVNDDKGVDAPTMNIEPEQQSAPSQSEPFQFRSQQWNSAPFNPTNIFQQPILRNFAQSINTLFEPLTARPQPNNNFGTFSNSNVLESRISELEKKINLLTQHVNVPTSTTQQPSTTETTNAPHRNIFEEPATNPENIHYGVSCDGCNQNPIKGRRFKCLVCYNFDLCEQCEASTQHAHPMVRCYTQANHFALNKIQRKFTKASGNRSNCGPRFMCPEGPRRRLLGRNRHVRFETDSRQEEEKINEQPHAQFDIREEKVTEPEKMNIDEDHSNDNQEEKKNILRFMFNSADTEAMDELVRRFNHLSLADFCEAISKEYERSL